MTMQPILKSASVDDSKGSLADTGTAFIRSHTVDGRKYLDLSGGIPDMPPVNCLGDYVALALVLPRSQSDSGIYIPNTNHEDSTGMVVGIGPDVSSLKIGDIVKFGPRTIVMDLTEDLADDFNGVTVKVVRIQSIVVVIK